MEGLTKRIFSTVGSAALALGIGCSKPEDEGRCEYNDFGECVQTFRSSDGKYVLDVRYGHRGDITQKLTAGDGSRTEDCFYKIERAPLGGLRLLKHSRNCPASLAIYLEDYFEFGRDRALRR